MCDTRVVYKGPLSGPRAPKDAYTRSIADRDVCGMVAIHLLSMGWLCLCVCVQVCRAQGPVQPQAHADYSSREAPPSWYQIGRVTVQLVSRGTKSGLALPAQWSAQAR